MVDFVFDASFSGALLELFLARAVDVYCLLVPLDFGLVDLDLFIVAPIDLLELLRLLTNSFIYAR